MNKILLTLVFLLSFTIAAQAQCGTASWYGNPHDGNKTASGEIFNKNQLTAAHRTLPFGTIVEVTNQNNGKKVTVKINDRGPFHGSRIIDLSEQAAIQIGIKNSGTGKVCLNW